MPNPPLPTPMQKYWRQISNWKTGDEEPRLNYFSPNLTTISKIIILPHLKLCIQPQWWLLTSKITNRMSNNKKSLPDNGKALVPFFTPRDLLRPIIILHEAADSCIFYFHHFIPWTLQFLLKMKLQTGPPTHTWTHMQHFYINRSCTDVLYFWMAHSKIRGPFPVPNELKF